MTPATAHSAERCEDCRFARRFVKPEPLPEPQVERVFFGLFSVTRKPSFREQLAHAIRMRTWENDIACCRFPQPVQNRRDHWCSEFRPIPKAEG